MDSHNSLQPHHNALTGIWSLGNIMPPSRHVVLCLVRFQYCSYSPGEAEGGDEMVWMVMAIAMPRVRVLVDDDMVAMRTCDGCIIVAVPSCCLSLYALSQAFYVCALGVLLLSSISSKDRCKFLGVDPPGLMPAALIGCCDPVVALFVSY